jgi:hypothetical protein
VKLARGLERRLENLVDGASASVFKGKMHPVVIGGKMLRQLDFQTQNSIAGPQIPNDLVVTMNPLDLDAELDHTTLIKELESVITESATEQGWRLVGPATVHVGTDKGIPRGVLECEGSNVPGPLPPWSHLIADDGSAVLDIAMNRTLIGRALDADLRIANEQVSRHHALIIREAGSVKISDLGSSNGTIVNRIAVGPSSVALGPGDNVFLGDLSFTYRPVS